MSDFDVIDQGPDFCTPLCVRKQHAASLSQAKASRSLVPRSPADVARRCMEMALNRRKQRVTRRNQTPRVSGTINHRVPPCTSFCGCFRACSCGPRQSIAPAMLPANPDRTPDRQTTRDFKNRLLEFPL